MVIQHNLPALNTYNSMKTSIGMMKSSQEKLSSGYRINRAGNDAAGLAISEKMRSQIRGLDQARRNCFDGISLVQTAEGALSTVHTILQRMTELAAEAANGTYDDSMDRSALQLEMAQLKDEINHIAESTAFGTTPLLDGSLSRSGEVSVGPKQYVQVGPTGPLVYVYDEVVHDVDATQTLSGSATLSGYSALKEDLKNQIVPQAVKAITSTFADTFSYLNGSKIGIGLSLYNNSSSSVLASVAMGAGGTLGDIGLSYTLNVNMATLVMDSDGNLSDSSRQELEATIAHEMMHALMDEAHTAGMIGRDSNWNNIEPFPDWFVEGAAQVLGGGRDWVNSIGINSSSTVDQIKSVLSNGANKIGSGSTSSQYATGYLAVMYLGHLASNSMSSAGLADGVDAVLRELKAGASLDAVINDLTGLADTTAFESKFADIGADFVADLMDAIGSGRGSLANKNLAQTDLLPDSDLSNSLFGLNTSNTQVKNDYPNGYEVMSGGGRSDTGTSPDGSVPSIDGIGGGGTSPTPNQGGGSASGGSTTAPSADLHRGLVLQVGARTKDTADMYIESVSTTKLGLDSVVLSTQEEANKAIDIIQSATTKVSMQRAELGAYHNRLQHKIENITVTSENLKASESYIRDTDIASEMSVYLRNKILNEAGYAILSQANASNQGVLSLLS